ncbi:Ger(x)C family spore germination protein [Priestia abyssalis]|uniref:Ger(x)C family spore germination protein n=1 Tax=Priestia abyssalis TaxID=1221450 RepID=UPI0014753AF7|nr:hypothetical protein [Priestia abyssalis]
MKKIICLVIITSVLSGCLRMKVVDQLNILKVIAFDKKEDKFEGMALYPQYTLSENQNKAGFLKAEASTAGLVLSKMNQQAGLPVEIGKLRMLVFGEDLAKAGVSEFVRTICRDPLIGSNMQIAFVENSAEELLKLSKKEGALFLSDLVEQNIKKKTCLLPTFKCFYLTTMEKEEIPLSLI